MLFIGTCCIYIAHMSKTMQIECVTVCLVNQRFLNGPVLCNESARDDLRVQLCVLSPRHVYPMAIHTQGCEHALPCRARLWA